MASIFCFAIISLSPKKSETSIFPSVKVPVLSTHITETPPNVSAAANFLTNPFLFNIFCIPIVRTTVNDTNKPSGMLETAKATDVINISDKLIL